MASSSKYSGLAGTVLLGTLLGLNYTQYARRKSPLADKGGAYDPESESPSGTLKSDDGSFIPFGKTNVAGSSFTHRLRGAIPDVSPLVVCGALSVLWAVRSFGAMQRVLNSRYNDVVYQIRRPDVISNRITAWKLLGLGCLVVPATFGAGVWYFTRYADMSSDSDNLKRNIEGISEDLKRVGNLSPLRIERSGFASSVSEFTRTLRDGFRT